MKESLINVPLRLQSLEMETSSLDDAVSFDPAKPSMYTFEITNMTHSDFEVPSAEQTDKDKQQQQ